MTENWARDLLTEAGDTLTPGPPPSFERLTKVRRWLPAVAAAAVLAAAVGAAVVLEQVGRPAALPQHAPPGADRVPSVFGLGRVDAVAALEDAGLSVTLDERPTCREVSDRPLGTDPLPGETLPADGSVILTTAVVPPGHACLYAGRDVAWQLIDLALGRGRGPDFADQVLLQVPSSAGVSADQARDPSTWPRCDDPEFADCPATALDILRRAVLRNPSLAKFLTIRQETRRGGADAYALTIDDAVDGEFGQPWAVHFEVGNGIFGPEGKVMSVYLDTQPHLKGWIPTHPREMELVVVPNVVGLDEEHATSALADAGLGLLESFGANSCSPITVLDQSPPAGTRVAAGSRVQLTVTDPNGCP